MKTAHLSAALVSLAVSAGAATASAVIYDESVDGDLSGSIADPASVTDFGVLAPGEHWDVFGTVGPRDTDERDTFFFTTTSPFTVDLIDFDLEPDNQQTTFTLDRGEDDNVSSRNIVADGTFPNLVGTQPAGSYFVQAIEVNLPQDYQLRLTAEVPLPAAGVMLVGGLAALGMVARRKRRG